MELPMPEVNEGVVAFLMSVQQMDHVRVLLAEIASEFPFARDRIDLITQELNAAHEVREATP
jgi:hypothetical protein